MASESWVSDATSMTLRMGLCSTSLKALFCNSSHVIIIARCSSFSVARDRTSVIRSARFPWGLPRRFLSDTDQEKVRMGNACARAALNIIYAPDSRGLPWCLENPHSSKTWYIPELQQLMASPHVQVVVIDFCQYKTRWKKPTRLLFGNLDESEAKNLPKSSTERIPEMPAGGSPNMSEVPKVVSHHPVAKPVVTYGDAKT